MLYSRVTTPEPRTGPAWPSLIKTCKLNGIDPQAYLTDVLAKLVNLWPAARIDELMPWAWAGADSDDGLSA
jgi:hypothetical protein